MIAEHKAELENAAGDVSPHATLKFAFMGEATDSHEGGRLDVRCNETDARAL